MVDAPAWALALLRDARVGRLATADADGRPLVVPVCYAFDGARCYSAVDAKPKRTRELRRLKNIAANPHVSLHYKDPEGEERHYLRATDKLPPEPKEIKPHPYGVELGRLLAMLKDTTEGTLSAFLCESFSRISPRTLAPWLLSVSFDGPSTSAHSGIGPRGRSAVMCAARTTSA